MAAFRIIQESLSNVQRHSGSDRASVLIDVEGDQLRVMVRDRGRGFDPNDGHRHERKRGLGIEGMKGRARQLGGKLDLQSGKGGTMVEARIPIPGEE
jgi:signal transduction histidine kinase